MNDTLDEEPTEVQPPDMDELLAFLHGVAIEECLSDPAITDEDNDGVDDEDENWTGDDRDDDSGGGVG